MNNNNNMAEGDERDENIENADNLPSNVDLNIMNNEMLVSDNEITNASMESTLQALLEASISSDPSEINNIEGVANGRSTE